MDRVESDTRSSCRFRPANFHPEEPDEKSANYYEEGSGEKFCAANYPKQPEQIGRKQHARHAVKEQGAEARLLESCTRA
jgi:hypothetical protein